jgi:hypothetical protein
MATRVACCTSDRCQRPGSAPFSRRLVAVRPCLFNFAHSTRVVRDKTPLLPLRLRVVTKFTLTWQRVQEHAGEVFTTVTGKEFRYSAVAGGVQMQTTNWMLPRSDFEKALDRTPVAGRTDTATTN